MIGMIVGGIQKMGQSILNDISFNHDNMTTLPFYSSASSNPIQRFQCVLQAMRNPAIFVKQTFPDIPDQIMNDPSQILSYLQRTRGISNDQLQKMKSNAQSILDKIS